MRPRRVLFALNCTTRIKYSHHVPTTLGPTVASVVASFDMASPKLSCAGFFFGFDSSVTAVGCISLLSLVVPDSSWLCVSIFIVPLSTVPVNGLVPLGHLCACLQASSTSSPLVNCRTSDCCTA